MTERLARNILWLTCGVILIGAPCFQQCSAGDGTVMDVPSDGTIAGLQLRLDDRWVRGDGYRRLKVEVMAAAGMAFSRDRNIIVQISPYARFDMRERERIEIPFRLSAGQSSVAKTVWIPQRRVQGDYLLKVAERGRWIRGLDTIISRGANYMGDGILSIVAVDFDAPTFAQRDRGETPDEMKVGDVGVIATLNGCKNRKGEATTNDWIERLPPSELPDEWRALTGVDLMLIEFPELQRMKSEAPGKLAVIMDWVRAGGNLVTDGAGREFSNLAALEQLLGVTPAPPGRADPQIRRRPQQGSWVAPDQRDYGRPVKFAENIETDRGVDDPTVFNTDQLSLDDFRYREVEFGTLVAFACPAGEMFPGGRNRWRWLMTKFGPGRLLAYRRNGQSTVQANPHVWYQAVPGVGGNPVDGFRIIISLFALVIGPINYFWLKRIGRLSWLQFTVPLGAALVVLAMFGFALITDGLGVKSRIRAVTRLDGRGHATTWSRQVFYASLVPSGGISFSNDAAVLPLVFDPPRSDTRGGPIKLWECSDRQYLRQGYFQSRSNSSFLIGRSGASELALDVGYGDGKVKVNNRLRARILHLYLIGPQTSQVFVSADPIDMGDSAELQFSSRDDAMRSLPAELSEFSLAMPPGMNTGAFSRRNRTSTDWEYRNANSEFRDVSFRGSLLESSIDDLQRNALRDLPSGRFVAIVDRCDEIPPAINNAEEAGSLYLIRGAYSAAGDWKSFNPSEYEEFDESDTNDESDSDVNTGLGEASQPSGDSAGESPDD